MKKGFIQLALLVCFIFMIAGVSFAQKIYWGDSVPEGWNGKWADKFLTVPEKTNYTRTTSSYEVLEFIDMLKWNSDKVYVITMFTSGMRKVCPAVVLANPIVTSPQQASRTGKPVVYIQGNIHPPEPEAKEAILMLMREILLGEKKYLLDNQIIIFCPCFNVDGNDTWSLNDGTPHLLGTRTNLLNFDLNRDAIKLETIEVNGLYRTIFNRWDPVLIYDGHAMGQVRHGYAIVYATSTVPTAHPGPRGYVFNTIFPALREAVRKNFGLEIFTHGMFDEENWPPTVWSHDRAIWSTEGKFVASAYGLRNRMSILAETPGHLSFEREIYAHYALISEILEYSNTHGKEMVQICKDADKEVVEAVMSKAETGELKNYVAGKYESWGKIDLLAYKTLNVEYIPGTSVRAKISESAIGEPELIQGVEHLTKPVGTKEAIMPRGYLIPAELGFIIEKLRTHNIKVEVLDKPVRVMGEEFVIDKMSKVSSMTRLQGNFFQTPSKEFPAGTYRVDLAQPLANLAFYCLEPEAADGFTGWGVLDNYLKSIGADNRSVVYPIFKYFKILQ
jgi:hypothetical protein